MPVKTIFITASSDPYSSVLIDHLIGKGHRLKVLGATSYTSKSGVEWLRGDIRNSLSFEHHLEGCDMIIHLAQLESYAKKDRPSMYAWNVLATRDLVNAALAYSVPSFIYVSTAFSLTRSANPLYIGLDAQGNPFFFSYYAQLKFECEMEVWRAEAEGLKTCILNIPFTPGSGLGKILLEYPPGQKPNYQEKPFAWIGSDHLCRVLLDIIEQELWSRQFLLYTDISSVSNFRMENMQASHKQKTFYEVHSDIHQAKESTSFLKRLYSVFLISGPNDESGKVFSHDFVYQSVSDSFLANQEEQIKLKKELKVVPYH